jgi:hypothetical protein
VPCVGGEARAAGDLGVGGALAKADPRSCLGLTIVGGLKYRFVVQMFFQVKGHQSGSCGCHDPL